MRRILFLTTCLSAPFAGQAADFPTRAPVQTAVVYLQGAEITRSAIEEVPAGRHRLLVPVPSDRQAPSRIELRGATLGTVEILPDAVTDGRPYLSPNQQQALAALEAAEDATHRAEDARLRAAAAMKAADDRLAFLRSVTGASLTTLDPDQITATATAVSDGTQAAEIIRADARADLRAAEQARDAANRVLEQAKRDLAASGADLGPITLMAVEIVAEDAGPVDLTLTSFAANAGWSPVYDIHLDADEKVTLTRKATVWQRTGMTLSEVDLTLSTADPFAQAGPSFVGPDRARVVEPQPRVSVQSDTFAMDTATGRAAPAPAIESAARLEPQFDGPVVTYVYPTAVTVPEGGGQVTLSLGDVTLDARVFNRAAPRLDETAFLMADVTNTSGEPILPGTATLFREDARVGETALPLLAAGGETELAFGAQQHLRLEFVLLDNATGDRGVFVTSGTREQEMIFRLRNLSDSPETVETRFALPFSEEEDLDIRVRATPPPDRRDVDDLRGVSEWDITLDGGAEAAVRIGVDLEWPEDETLIWRP
ncbi:DUF4139 domain-containing protein [Jannaschia sp. 2305UL9-9]|uniref:DUF4139 domain-containing protein n=1 Tax=Jannaschia sp. 2305UL9-9 TaxID=3121638 RepID=UPI00352857DB